MAVPWSLIDYENELLQAIREMDAVNTSGGAPNFGMQFSKVVIDRAINQAIADLLMLSGYQPRLSDRIVSVPTTTLTDLSLPTDCAALQRVEYQQSPLVSTSVTSGGFAAGTRTVTLADVTNVNVGDGLTFDTVGSGVQEIVILSAVTVVAGIIGTVTGVFANAHGVNCVVQSGPLSPYRLQQLTPDEFDAVAGTGWFGTTVVSLGLPTSFREPIAGAIRFYPQIGPLQVANGDSLNFTYSSYGTQLVANGDVANIPVGFQRGVILGAEVPLWRVKGDDDQADRAERRFEKWCNEARKYRWNLPQAGTFGFLDEDLTAPGVGDYVQW